MIQETPRVEEFKTKLRETLQRETLRGRSIKYEIRRQVYGAGDSDEMIYFIQSGQVKLSMTSPAGKECVLAIHTGGDIFGELCPSGIGTRSESAITMRSTVLKQLPSAHFFTCLGRDGLVEGFVRYLAVRVADQQTVIRQLPNHPDASIKLARSNRAAFQLPQAVTGRIADLNFRRCRTLRRDVTGAPEVIGCRPMTRRRARSIGSQIAWL